MSTTNRKAHVDELNIQPLDSLIEQWFSCLSYRERKVLEYLYLDPNNFSFKAVSRIISVSLDRLADIRSRAFNKLVSPEVYSIVEPVAMWLFALLGEADESISESQLVATMRRELIVGQIDPLGIVGLLSALQINPASCGGELTHPLENKA